MKRLWILAAVAAGIAMTGCGDDPIKPTPAVAATVPATVAQAQQDGWEAAATTPTTLTPLYGNHPR